jgi:hypothetical protein
MNAAKPLLPPLPAPFHSAEDFLAASADEAMYRVKNAG